MKIIGFNFSRVHAERLPGASQSVKINTNIDVSSIDSIKSDFLKTKDEILRVKFSYIVEYHENIAKIELEGEILVSLEQKISKEIIKQWEDKKIPEEFRVFLFNSILMKSNLKALQLEEEINLPPHIPFPTLKSPEPEK